MTAGAAGWQASRQWRSTWEATQQQCQNHDLTGQGHHRRLNSFDNMSSPVSTLIMPQAQTLVMKQTPVLKQAVTTTLYQVLHPDPDPRTWNRGRMARARRYGSGAARRLRPPSRPASRQLHGPPRSAPPGSHSRPAAVPPGHPAAGERSRTRLEISAGALAQISSTGAQVESGLRRLFAQVLL